MPAKLFRAATRSVRDHLSRDRTNECKICGTAPRRKQSETGSEAQEKQSQQTEGTGCDSQFVAVFERSQKGFVVILSTRVAGLLEAAVAPVYWVPGRRELLAVMIVEVSRS